MPYTADIARHRGSSRAHRSPTRYREAEVIDRMVKAANDRMDIEAQHGKPTQLVKDGVWQVPPEARPKGWEKMPVREA